MPGAKTPASTIQQTVSFALKFNNKKLEEKYQVMLIHVWNEVNKVSRARVAIMAGDSYMKTFPESELSNFEPGKDVEISIGYDSVNAVVFKGIILRHRIEVAEGYLQYNSRSQLVLDCSDKAVKMTMERKTAIFEDKLDSQVITSMLSTAGLTKTVDATKVTHPFLVQYDISDWDFMLKRAKANGLVVLNASNEVKVKAPAVSGSSVVTVTQGEDASTFRGEIDASTQHQKIESKSWDTFKETELKQNSSEPANMTKPGNKTGATLGKVAAAATTGFSVKTPLTTKELKALADGALMESRLKRVRGEVSFRGVNTVKLGTIITLAGFGKLFNGDVYVSSVEHIVKEGSYQTRAGFGLSENVLQPPLKEVNNNWLGPVSGLHVGIVKKIDTDPLTQYRIKVQIPSIKASGEGMWAMLTHFYATTGAGSFFIPEVNSEVIVGFLNDDPRYPVVLGSLYNSKKKPKEKFTTDNAKKSIVTKNKLFLEFDDKDKIITISTPGKNKIVISDKDKKITVTDQHSNSIETSSNGITVKSKKNITFDSKAEIKLTASKAITIKSSSDNIKLDGKDVDLKAKGKFKANSSSGADIKSSGTVNIKGSMVNVN